MRMRLLSLFLVLTPAALVRADDRKAPPDAAAQAKAEQKIRDLFKSDFAKRKPADLQELAGKLLKQAGQSGDDAVSEFVLLRLAGEIAARAGDAAQALQAIDAQARDFAVNAPALKSKALSTTMTAGGGASIDYQTILDAALPTADEAEAADDFDSAGHLLRIAVSAAQKAGNKQLGSVAGERVKLVEAMEKEYDKVKDDVATLKAKPDDADASLHVGRFNCFFKGDWDKGLPLLAKGSDAKLQDLAKKDLARPTAPGDQAALADAWMDVADNDILGKTQIELHALAWYKLAAGQLAGLDKTRVEKKVSDLDEVAKKYSVPEEPPEPGWVVLFRSLDPRIWDTEFNGSRNAFAVPLSKAPEGVQYLKLTLTSTHEYVVIPMTNEALKKRAEPTVTGWEGRDYEDHHGYHLGLFALPPHEPAKGEIGVTNFGIGKECTGWGFGHRCRIDDIQGYVWAGSPLPPVVFEISVKSAPLSDKEMKHLVGKK